MMPFRALRPRAALIALAFPCVWSPAALAQKSGDKDLKEISAYTWTMPKYQKLMAAMVNLGTAAQNNPTLGKSMEGSGNLTIDQTAARFDGVPPAKKAIADAGLTPREFAVAQGAWLQSAMSYAVMKQYKLSADSVSKTTGVSKANLEFFQTNEVEINRMAKEMQAKMPKDPADSGEGEDADSTE
jgi:hypothetical protein